MPERPLDLEILRKGRREDVIGVTADVTNAPALQAALRSWLEGHGWDQGRWGEFELVARFAGESRVRAKVRT